MKILVVGGVAGGASAAARARRLDESAEIIIFERGEHVSFSNCALPYYIGGDVDSSEKLIMMTPMAFKKRFNIDVRTRSEVTAINKDEKTLTVKNLETGEEYKESYDKLILAPGASPIRPRSIAGIDRENVFTIRNVNDTVKFRNYMLEHDCKNIAVIGGGFIGIEMAENISKNGISVSLIEGMDQVLAPLDYDMVQMVHKELDDHGIKLYLSHMLKEIKEGSVVASKDGVDLEIPADAVVLSIGVAAETKLVADAGLEVSNRRIKVNESYQTSDPDIYAVGDAIESYDRLARKYGGLALAGPAQRQARAAAGHIYGQPVNNKGYIGSSCIRVFGLNIASTGLNEKTAAAAGIPCEIAYVIGTDKVGIMPGNSTIFFKLIFEIPTGRILGAQCIGAGNVIRRVDVIATLITMNGTLEDLKELELCYSPVFSTAKDIVNIAALVGLNILTGRVKQVHVSDVRALAESGACIIDVREPGEYEAGHIKGAKNIPLGQLRDRIDEVPRDIPVYLHCRSSQRSYYAYCQLLGHGYKNIFNVSGSFLGLSMYEYFNDKTEGREPIVTAYNFK